MIELLTGGWCRHPECSLIAGGSWRTTTLPAGVVVIRHPRLGLGLFDTGYSQRFLEATKKFPECLYRWLTPPLLPLGSSIREQLAQRGIAATEVRWILLSHLHADHVAGIIDFPRASIFLHAHALRAMRQRGRWNNLLHGVLPALLPDDLDQRTTLLHAHDFKTTIAPGWQGHDLSGDGALCAVPLPGHAAGHLGLWIRPPHAAPTLLVGDAAWTMANIEQFRSPPAYARFIFESSNQAQHTLGALHTLHRTHPELRLIPSHCPSCWPAYAGSEPAK